MLEIRNLGVRYGRHLALDGVSARVGKGEICVVLGANGAGKSSLLKAVAGMVAAAPGSEVTMNGRSLVGMKPHRIVEQGIALVPEGRGIFGDLTVAENLTLGAFAARARNGERRTLERIYETFPRLAERRRQVARTMSGGEQQMVAIGRALMSNPEILMLDEPSLGLSPLLTKDMFKSLSAIAATGVGILLVEQNARQSLKIAGRGYLIENGAIAGEDTAEALMNDPAVVSAYLGGASTRPAPPPRRMPLPGSFGLPSGAAAIGRFVGDLAGRAQRIQTAFVRQLRRDGGLPSAFVGRYDPKAAGDPWQGVDVGQSPVAATPPRASADAARLAAHAGDLAARAGERFAGHVRSLRLTRPAPSAFARIVAAPVPPSAPPPSGPLPSQPQAIEPAVRRLDDAGRLSEAASDLAARAGQRLAAHLRDLRLAAPAPSAFVRVLDPLEADTAPDAGIAPVGGHGLIGHNSARQAGFEACEADPAVPPSLPIADLVARAAAIHAAHVARTRRTLTAFVMPARPAATEPDGREPGETEKLEKH